MRRAAEIAYTHFGADWLGAQVGSPESDIRRKLQELMWAALPSNHANKSVPWKRFQMHVQAMAEQDRKKNRGSGKHPSGDVDA